MTVFRLTPTMREVARMEQPSTKAATMRVRFSGLSTLAIGDIMLERLGKIKAECHFGRGEFSRCLRAFPPSGHCNVPSEQLNFESKYPLGRH